MHGDVELGGPVWLFATAVLLLTVGLGLFVVFDVVRRIRRGRDEAVGRGALVAFAVGEGVFLLTLVAVQLLQGVSLVSAVPVVLMPFALAGGIAYLLKVVYPRG
ncbi:MAG: hypothetical protein U1E26_03955 [Coriobacteriia bacterium]|nr:hypothetical protein [Coriobacteriia bacterium]